MQKLELEQVIGYVPYDLEIVASDVNHDEAKFVVIGIHQKMFTVIDNEEQSDEVYHFEMSEAKPLLIPLSELKNTNAYEDIARTCEQRMVDEYYHIRLEGDYSPLGMPYWVFTILLEYHFDVFGLIDKGLALNKLDYGK